MERNTDKLEKKAKEYGRMIANGSESSEIGNVALDAYIAGANWQMDNMWISINDRDNVIPNDKDVLIRMSNGEVRRYNEDWESEFALDGTVTHWMPIPEIKKGE